MKTIGIFRNQLFKGSEVFISQQAEAIQAYNKCYIGRRALGSKPSSTTSWLLNANGTRKEKLAELYNALTTSAQPYLHILQQQPLDLIHAHFAIDGIYGLALANKRDIPLITTLHGFDVTVKNKDLLASRSPAWINYFLQQKKLKKEGDKFIGVSDFIVKQAIRNGFPEDKIIKHYIGIDVEKYQPAIAAEQTGIILHVARLVEKKGTAVLLEAIKKVKASNKDVQLVIIGEGPLLCQLQAQTAAYGIDSNVTFTGALPHAEVMTWMRKASMLALPSLTAKTGDAEGLGMVLLEASVTAIPVIGSNHGGIPEAIIDEKTGFLVQEGDTQQLAERILFLLNNEAKRCSIGREARTFVTENFNLALQTKKLEDIYREVIHG
ncbi:Glycosyltransferase involved in cell wall bisynthesis [Kosakonia sacchari]|nr:Glycosyltransferase involved in cell wall bisynthesis [Kosakonia sacchari]